MDEITVIISFVLGFLMGVLMDSIVFPVLLKRLQKLEEEVKAEPFDPCETCQRWGECNGVDRENCPLWRDHDNKEDKKDV